MPLFVPTADDIEQRIHIRMQGENVALTDLSVISTLRIIVREMIVEELMRLWAALSQAHNAFFITSATGDDLDRRLADYGLVRPGAEAASGYVMFFANPASEVVPAGTIVRTDPQDPQEVPKRYAVSANPDDETALGNPLVGSWLVAAGAARLIPVVALEQGVIGNTAANTITAMESPLPNIVSITNPTAIGNGRDVASDQEFREYFRQFLLSLQRGSRGSIIRACLDYRDPETGARPVHSVALEEWDGINQLDGTASLRVYIEDGSGQANADLIGKIQRLLDGSDIFEDPGVRAAGLRTVVTSATPHPVNVIADVDISSAVSVEDTKRLIRDVIFAHLTALPVSGITVAGAPSGRLIISRLFRDIMNVPGTLRLALGSPPADIFLPTGYKVVPGNIVVNIASVT